MRMATAWVSPGTPYKTAGTSAQHLYLMGKVGKQLLPTDFFKLEKGCENLKS